MSTVDHALAKHETLLVLTTQSNLRHPAWKLIDRIDNDVSP
jgi:hypothetical protein